MILRAYSHVIVISSVVKTFGYQIHSAFQSVPCTPNPTAGHRLLRSPSLPLPLPLLPFRPSPTIPRRMSVQDDTTERKPTPTLKTQATTPTNLLRNFRLARGVPKTYRCASTDCLAFHHNNDHDDDHDNDKDTNIYTPETIVLHQAGLVLDLRSPSERNESQALEWTSNTPNAPFSIRHHNDENDEDAPLSPNERTVYRIDVLSPKRLFAYLDQNWLPTATIITQLQSALYRTFDGNKWHELQMDVLNSKGLGGLYEAIIETSGAELCFALKLLTQFWEGQIQEVRQEHRCAVIHCVQGKDRTGLLVMLCQSIAGLSDEEIIEDYHLSDQMATNQTTTMTTGSAAMNHAVNKSDDPSSSTDTTKSTRKRGKLDRTVFSGAPRVAMVETLSFIRSKYGSVCPGYLDAIGFDSEWRRRYRAAISLDDSGCAIGNKGKRNKAKDEGGGGGGEIRSRQRQSRL